MRSRISLVLVALIGFIASAACLTPAAQAEATASSFGSRLVDLVNAARTNHGLRPLTVTTGTSTVAIGWTQHLAAAKALSHNPNLAAQLESHGSPNWTSYGENVGVGPKTSAQTLFNAYMNSPEHRANILGASYRYLGVGVVYTADGNAWNTLDFVDQYSSPTRTSTSGSGTTGTGTTSTTTTRHSTTTTTTRRTTQQVRPAPVHARPATAPRPAHRRLTRPAPLVSVQALASTVPTHDQVSSPVSVSLAALHPASHRGPGRGALPYVAAVWLAVMAAARFVLLRRQRAA